MSKRIDPEAFVRWAQKINPKATPEQLRALLRHMQAQAKTRKRLNA